MNLKVILICILIIVLLIGNFLLFTRTFLHEELDDVHPRIMNTDDPHIKRSEWLWVIPLYMDDPISNYPEWINNLKNTGKKLGLHGVKHTHKEFEVDRSDDYIDKGVKEFYKAFGYYPKYFKAPSLAMTKNNTKKIKERGMEIKSYLNQVIHTVHHSPKHRHGNGKLIGEYD